MPKVTTITKEIIVNAAFELVRSQGFLSLSARNVAKNIGCSTQPIYWAYKNMDDLKQDVIVKISDYLNNMLMTFRKTGKPFLDLGIAYVRVAFAEPVLFKAIYVDNILNVSLVDIIPDEILINIVKKDDCASELSDEAIKEIAVKAWIYVHGLASLISAGIMQYDEEKVEHMIESLIPDT